MRQTEQCSNFHGWKKKLSKSLCFAPREVDYKMLYLWPCGKSTARRCSQQKHNIAFKQRHSFSQTVWEMVFKWCRERAKRDLRGGEESKLLPSHLPLYLLCNNQNWYVSDSKFWLDPDVKKYSKVSKCTSFVETARQLESESLNQCWIKGMKISVCHVQVLDFENLSLRKRNRSLSSFVQTLKVTLCTNVCNIVRCPKTASRWPDVKLVRVCFCEGLSATVTLNF